MPILFTLGIGEYIIRKYVPNPYKTKKEQLIKHSNEIETIVLGSSHAYFGFRPEFIPRSFSLANTSQDYHYDLFLVEKYASKCSNLKTLILPISYFSFFSKGFEEGKEDSWTHAINYKIYMDCPFHSDFSKYNFELSNPTTYVGKLRSLISGSKIQCDSLGWGEAYKLEDKLPTWETKDATEAAKRHTNDDWSALDRNIADFESIVQYCKSHSVKLILITTPTWPAYYEKLDSKQLSKMYSIIQQMQEKYNLPYYNYLKDNRFEPEDFYDSDHLSNVGAKKFTLILRDEVLKN